MFFSACRKYKTLRESWRKITGYGPSTGNGKYNCDFPRNGGGGIKEGWHRFSGPAGTHLPTNRMNSGSGVKEVCGTSIVAWIDGSHPTIYDGVVSRDFCFEWTTGPCQYTVRSEVKTCPDPKNPGETFYVYKLKYPPGITCNWAYCAYGWKLHTGWISQDAKMFFYNWNRNISFSLIHIMAVI